MSEIQSKMKYIINRITQPLLTPRIYTIHYQQISGTLLESTWILIYTAKHKFPIIPFLLLEFQILVINFTCNNNFFSNTPFPWMMEHEVQQRRIYQLVPISRICRNSKIKCTYKPLPVNSPWSDLSFPFINNLHMSKIQRVMRLSSNTVNMDEQSIKKEK